MAFPEAFVIAQMGPSRSHPAPPVHDGVRLSKLGVPLPPRGALDAAVRAFIMRLDARLQSDLTRYAGVAELILLPPTNLAARAAHRFEQADRLIRAAL